MEQIVLAILTDNIDGVYIMGKKLREYVSSRVWRKTVEDSFAQNLFGYKTLKTYWCKTCRQHKPQAEFYVESSSKSKRFGQVRNQCVSCWDTHFGKLFMPKKGTGSLFEFLK